MSKNAPDFVKDIKALVLKLFALEDEFREIEDSLTFKANAGVASFFGYKKFAKDTFKTLDDATGYGKLFRIMMEKLEGTLKPYGIPVSYTHTDKSIIVKVGDEELEIEHTISGFIVNILVPTLKEMEISKSKVKAKGEYDLKKEFDYLEKEKDSFGNFSRSDFKKDSETLQNLIIKGMEYKDIIELKDVIDLIQEVSDKTNGAMNNEQAIVWGQDSEAFFLMPSSYLIGFITTPVSFKPEASKVEVIDFNNTLTKKIQELSEELQDKMKSLISNVDLNELKIEFKDFSFPLMLFYFQSNSMSSVTIYRDGIKGALKHIGKIDYDENSDIPDAPSEEIDTSEEDLERDRKRERKYKTGEEFEVDLRTTIKDNPKFKRYMESLMDKGIQLYKGATSTLKYYVLTYNPTTKYFLFVPRDKMRGKRIPEIPDSVKNHVDILVHHYASAVLDVWNYIITNFQKDIKEISSSKLTIEFSSGEVLDFKVFPITNLLKKLLKEYLRERYAIFNR